MKPPHHLASMDWLVWQYEQKDHALPPPPVVRVSGPTITCGCSAEIHPRGMGMHRKSCLFAPARVKLPTHRTLTCATCSKSFKQRRAGRPRKTCSDYCVRRRRQLLRVHETNRRTRVVKQGHGYALRFEP